MTADEKNRMQKKWDTEIKSLDSWSMFKVMGELVNGFDHYAKLGPCVAIFGSARTKEDNPYYIGAEETAYQLVKKGYGVITGGGPDIMEAGNRGAQRGGGISAGCNIVLEFEQAANKYIDTDKLVTFDYFFTRKTMFMRYAQGFIVFPGGFGTFDELFEAITLIQTKKIAKFPIILFGSKFWNGLFEWVKESVLLEAHNISEKDLEIYNIVDTPEEAVKIIEDFYRNYEHKPNF